MKVTITGIEKLTAKVNALNSVLPGLVQQELEFQAACLELSCLTGKTSEEIADWARMKSQELPLTSLEVVERASRQISEARLRQLIADTSEDENEEMSA